MHASLGHLYVNGSIELSRFSIKDFTILAIAESDLSWTSVEVAIAGLWKNGTF